MDPSTKRIRKGMTLIRFQNNIQLSQCDAGGKLYPSFTTKPGVGATPGSGYLTATVDGRRIPLPGVFAFGGYKLLLPYTVSGSIYADTEALVETGCGYGRNIYDMINIGIDTDIDLYCMEFVDSARNTARLVSKFLISTHSVTVLPIDYRFPDFSVILAKGYKRVTVMTMTSIEQVPEVPHALVDGMLSLAPKVDVVHIEPIGWQMRDDLRTPARQGAQRHNVDGSTGAQTNQNLWPLLLQFAYQQNKIVIDEAQPEMMTWGWSLWGVYSLVRWHKRQGNEIGKVQAFLNSSTPGPDTGSIGGPWLEGGSIRPMRKIIN